MSDYSRVVLTGAEHERLNVLASRRLNVGCGDWPLAYWQNLDAAPSQWPDLVIQATVPPLPFEDESLDEIYAGHFLEHLSEHEAQAFLSECRRCLTDGGKLGIVVPDTREVMTRWLAGSIDCAQYGVVSWCSIADLDDVCRLFLYSTVQASPHKWSYDLGTLGRLLERSGFTVTAEIDRYRDERLGSGQWFQCGWDAVKA